VRSANFDQLESERLDLGDDAAERCLIGQRSRQHRLGALRVGAQ
jgi:hypothetical protein